MVVPPLSLKNDLPLYPPLLQLVRVTAATVPGPSGFDQLPGSSVLGPQLYVAFVQQLRSDGSLLPRDREPCLADDVNGLGATPGFYHGRLAGSFNSLPVYEIIAPATSSSGGGGSGGSLTITGTYNFGTSVFVSISPPGILSKPTQLVTGAPTWTPAANTYPLLWNAWDHIEWEYDGLIRTPGGISAIPGDTGWTAFVSVGRIAVNDANYTAITIDRTVGYASISAPRVVTLPPANSLPPGFTLVVQDDSGDASVYNTVSVRRSGSNIVNGGSADVVVVNAAYSGSSITTNGVSEWTVRRPPRSLIKKTVYTANNTWIPDPATASAVVEVIAGGGGGGGAVGDVMISPNKAGIGAGGGGGGYAKSELQPSDYGVSQTITVGSGGAGGANTGANGSAGGNSSFGALVTATGGGGGTWAQTAGGVCQAGAGGVGTGDVAGAGSPGNQGIAFATTDLLPALVPVGGNGGSCGSYGGGGLGSIAGVGSNGQGKGGGGGGAATGGAGFAGGNGTAGEVIVWEYS